MNLSTRMKQKVVLPIMFAVTIIALFLGAGCKMPNALKDLVSSEDEAATLSLSFSNSSGRTIQPGISMSPSFYEISGIGPDGKTFAKTSPVSPVSIDGLTSGDWTVKITAKNSNSQSIGYGSGTKKLVSGTTTGLNILVAPIAGTGTLALDLLWPAAEVASATVEATLIPATGSNVQLPVTISYGHATVSQTVPSGYYTLVLNLLDNSTVVMGTIEVVRIVTDQTTNGAFVFHDLNTVSGSYQINISPELSDPLAVTISGGTASLATGSSMTLNASVGTITSNILYVWYLNGINAGTGSSCVFGGTANPLAEGSYRASVSAYTADGSQAGSASFAFVVSTGTTVGTILHGRDITALNTGVPAGHTLTNVTSTIRVTESWITNSNGGSRVLENRNFTNGADLFITVDGFTVRYCKFNGTSELSLYDYTSSLPIGKNVSLLYSEFDGNHQNFGGDVAIYGSSLTLKGVHVHRWPRAMFVGDGNVTVEECYFHDLTADGGDAHLENIYVAGGANQTYIRNKLISNEIHINGDNNMMTSASLAIYNEDYERGYPFPSFPRLENILVQDNYFESDGYFALYCGALSGKLPAPYARYTVIKGNVFGRLTGLGGAGVAFDPSQIGNLWQNNTWGPKGPSTPASDPAEGTLIAAPGVS